MLGATAGDPDVKLQVARDAEATFLQELHDALGMDEKSEAIHNWFRKSGNSNSVCDFTGVQCDVHGLVTILDLSSKGLAGSLPGSFAPLTRLQRLLLRNNNIGGNVPWELPQNLLHFNVDRNRLQGTIPSFQFTSFASSPSVSPQLERLILSDNLLQGTLPTTVCSLGQLKALNLSRNPDLRGRLPECLAALSALNGLQVLGTKIIGPILPGDLCRPKKETNSTLEGHCARFGFCLDGYRQVSSFQDGINHVFCQACPVASNVLASRTCQWFEPESPAQHRSPSPLSTHPSDSSSIVPSRAPSLPPSMLPSTLPSANQVLSSTPSPFRPLWKHFKVEMSASRDLVPSALPTIHPSEVLDSDRSSTNGLQSQDRATSQQERSFYDRAGFLPVFVLLCLMGLAASLLSVPGVWNQVKRRRGIKACCSLAAAAPADDATPFADEENMDEDEEITFSKDDWRGGGMGDLLEAGVNSLSNCDCEVFGCHISAPFAASNTMTTATTEPQLGKKNQVTSRPCIVRPETVTANPKVHFLLLARSLSSVEDDEVQLMAASPGEEGNEDEETLSSTSEPKTRLKHSETNHLVRACATTFPTMGALFCAPSCMPARRNIVPTSKTSGTNSQEEEMLTTSRTPTPSRGAAQDLFYGPDIAADSSSLSSTTPMLNPFDSLRAKMMPLSWRATITPRNRCVDKDDDALIAEYARKYFPAETATLPPPPPVNQVDCLPDPDVSFSLSVSQDGPDLPQEQQNSNNNTPGKTSHGGDLSSFRPPRFYKRNPTPPPTPVPHVKEGRVQANTDVEDYSVLGIRSPFADYQSDDDYEVEVLDFTEGGLSRHA